MIKKKLFHSYSIEASLKEALEWINKNNINVISISEYRSTIWHGGVFVIYKEKQGGKKCLKY